MSYTIGGVTGLPIGRAGCSECEHCLKFGRMSCDVVSLVDLCRV